MLFVNEIDETKTSPSRAVVWKSPIKSRKKIGARVFLRSQCCAGGYFKKGRSGRKTFFSVQYFARGESVISYN